MQILCSHFGSFFAAISEAFFHINIYIYYIYYILYILYVYIYIIYIYIYIHRLRRGVIPKGLRIRKNPAFEPISDNFQIKWNKILYHAEKDLVKLLLYELSKVVVKLEIDVHKELLNRHPNDYKENGLRKRIRKMAIEKVELD